MRCITIPFLYAFYQQISFKDSVSHSGNCEIKFPINSFMADKNDFCRKFGGINTSKDFATKLKTTLIHATPSSSAASSTRVVTVVEAETLEEESRQKTPTKTTKRGNRKRKAEAQLVPEGGELTSPEKIPKANHVDDEIETHFLGKS